MQGKKHGHGMHCQLSPRHRSSNITRSQLTQFASLFAFLHTSKVIGVTHMCTLLIVCGTFLRVVQVHLSGALLGVLYVRFFVRKLPCALLSTRYIDLRKWRHIRRRMEERFCLWLRGPHLCEWLSVRRWMVGRPATRHRQPFFARYFEI